MGAQSELFWRGDPAADGFRFTWWNTREGTAVFVQRRGSWRPGLVVRCYRKSVSVMLTDRDGKPVYIRHEYGDLRRRVIKPRLTVVAKA